MKVLVINAGSSTLKYQLIDVEHHSVLAKGLCDRIGLNESIIQCEFNGNKDIIKHDLKTHKEAVKYVLNLLISEKYNSIIKSLEEIDAIGHRIVHGGEYFKNSVIINPKVKQLINECSILAPLHNPPHIMGIEACEELTPNIKQVAVFDTAFHQTLPEIAYMYALPRKYYETYKIRKYGFHGTSHKYVSKKASEFIGCDIKNLKIISCHLGNGSSITAIKDGISIDTSMGFTPLEGLIMGSRCGSIDPAIIPFIMEKENINTGEITNIMNKKSGLLALSSKSSDLRDIEKEADNGNHNSKLAYEAFAYSVKKYIGSYSAIMGGLDVLIFTAGIGENSWRMRELILKNMKFLGIDIDIEKNKNASKFIDISSDKSNVKVLVLPTDEEYMIAFDTKNVIQNDIYYTE